jgi:hypothetical protein
LTPATSRFTFPSFPIVILISCINFTAYCFSTGVRISRSWPRSNDQKESGSHNNPLGASFICNDQTQKRSWDTECDEQKVPHDCFLRFHPTVS